MHFSAVQTPPRIAARPQDDRGYPVPAITPWVDGEPRFAVSSPQRAFICASERRCSVCALEVAAGPVWRVVSGIEADAIEAAQAAGHPYVNKAPTVEAPGHLTCMLYAALVCPYLARPNARRGSDAEIGGLAHHAKGEARGEGGAVVGYHGYQYAVVDGRTLFRFTELAACLPFGDHLAAELAAQLAAEAEPGAGAAPEPSPPYLLDDEQSVITWSPAVRKADCTTKRAEKRASKG